MHSSMNLLSLLELASAFPKKLKHHSLLSMLLTALCNLIVRLCCGRYHMREHEDIKLAITRKLCPYWLGVTDAMLCYGEKEQPSLLPSCG